MCDCSMMSGTILFFYRQPGLICVHFCSRAGARSFDPFTTKGSNERAILTGGRLVASGAKNLFKMDGHSFVFDNIMIF